jgi:hypothetical protein
VILKDTAQPRIGAFEITHNENIVFSKLISGLFPVGTKVAQRAKSYLADLAKN